MAHYLPAEQSVLVLLLCGWRLTLPGTPALQAAQIAAREPQPCTQPSARTALQGLHIEDNPLARRLGPHPCFHNLVELLLDWKDALSAYDALHACTRLTRLTLTNHTVYGTTDTGSVPLPATFGDRLLDALAAMPSLQLIEDVVDPNSLDLLVPAVARCMWQLGRVCPHVRLELITSTFVSAGAAGVSWAVSCWAVVSAPPGQWLAALHGCLPGLTILLLHSEHKTLPCALLRRLDGRLARCRPKWRRR